MPRSPSQVSSNPDLDIRRRIDAMTGKVKPTAAMVKGSIQPLINKLAKQARERETRDHLNEQRFKILSELYGDRAPIPDPAEVAASKAHRDALSKRARAHLTKPPVIMAVPPQIKSGSILTFDISPYSARWEDKGTANHLLGNWSTNSGNGNSGYDHSSAGVCVFFTPQEGRYPVRFAPYMPHSFWYSLSTWSSPFTPWAFGRASCSGFLGAYVAAFDGNEWVGITDSREEVFSRAVSVNDDAEDSDETSWGSPQANFITLGRSFTYALWAWGGVSIYTRGGHGGFDYGLANASLSTSIPWMVIEQSI